MTEQLNNQVSKNQANKQLIPEHRLGKQARCFLLNKDFELEFFLNAPISIDSLTVLHKASSLTL
jgi:hypothetical protein